MDKLAAWLPSRPYPYVPPGTGYWLPQTSTINWCEEDYYATIYSAEIVNTLTNLLFILFAIKGIVSCLREDHPRVFLVSFFGYCAVGTGSFLFHASLKYPMQLVDELSMIYTTSFSCFASFTYRRGTLYRTCVGIFFISLAAFITAYYHYLKDPRFHQRAYAALTATVLFRGWYVMEVNLRPRWKKYGLGYGPLDGKSEASGVGNPDKHPALRDGKKRSIPVDTAEQRRRDDRDRRILMYMWALVAYGLGIFLAGFAIWQLDNKYCTTLRRWRHQVGLPWGILLEGHGWWHLMTGFGAYFYITWGIWLRHCLNGRQDDYELHWPRLIFSLPEIRRKSVPRIDADGDSKKSR